jgi:glycine/D-amino acid oxidase-like deaminating enzyme
MSGRNYGDISLWMQDKVLPPVTPLPGDRRYDVAIVGGGYTGLWTAWYLKTLAPELAVSVLEAHICGFGASGRNGGWMMAALEGEHKLLAGVGGEQGRAVLAAIKGILPEVESVLASAGIDCDYRRGGGLFAAARYPEQARSQREQLAGLHSLGYDVDDYRWLEADELSARLAIHHPLGAIYTPHIARIQPASLVLGLAAAVRDLGVDIFEQTRALSMDDKVIHTDRGVVAAATRVLAVEGFSYGLPDHRRRVLPVQSRIIATEPLSADLWSQLGLAKAEVFCDASPLITYGQRNADDRLVFGARGTYEFGGRPRSDFSGQQGAFESVHRLLLACLPQLAGVPISHRWGGTLGVPRAGTPHAVYDPLTGSATAGGYQGEGVGAANLMARTLADLILARKTELVSMPWAHRAPLASALRRWEPEPLRWLGYKATSLSLVAQEWCYRQQLPAPVVNLVRASGRLLERLRD